MDNVQLAGRIRALCKEQGIKLGEMLVSCGVSRNYLYDMEKKGASPSVDILGRIASYLGVPLSVLVGEEPPAMDDFTYAMYERSGELSEDEKKMLMNMAELLRRQKDDGSGKGI